MLYFPPSIILALSHKFWRYVFIFIQIGVFLIPLQLSLDSWLLTSVLINVHVWGNFLDRFLQLVKTLILLHADIIFIIIILCFIKTCLIPRHSIHLGEWFICYWEECLFCFWMENSTISINLHWLILMIKSSLSITEEKL